MIHGAIIEVSKELLLNILDFEGGEILNVWVDKELWEPKTVKIAIKHPDLPEVPANERFQTVVPTYQQVYKRQLVTVERLDPPKSS